MRLTAEQVEIILQASKDAIRSKEILEKMERLQCEIDSMRNEVVALFGGRNFVDQISLAVDRTKIARNDIENLNARINEAGKRIAEVERAACGNIKQVEQAAFEDIKQIEAQFMERMDAKILAMRSEFGP